jgi:hypothetical protein
VALLCGSRQAMQVIENALKRQSRSERREQFGLRPQTVEFISPLL